MKIWKQSGFTLVEVIVVAGIIAILAGILVPLILKEIDESRITRAYADIRSISNAVIIFKKDTGKWPNLDGGCAPTMTLLVGEGTIPSNAAAMSFDPASTNYFANYFSRDDTGCYGSRWKGPYMTIVSADPWGNSYLINTDGLSGTGPVWVISAGPDGAFDTGASNTSINGDDVGVRLR